MELNLTETEKKESIGISPIDTIPEDMMHAFQRETEGQRPKTPSISKLGAFIDEELIGFATAHEFEEMDALVIDGLYVGRKHRRKSVATQLVTKMLEIAQKGGYKALDVADTTLDADFLMGYLRGKWKEEGKKYKYDYLRDEGGAGYWRISF